MPKVIKPQEGPQTAFLSCSADICFYGGQAGGGKTFALVMEPLRHCHVPGFTALTFRRKSVEIRGPGGLWDASHAMYSALPDGVKPTPREQQMDWTFNSGASIKFAHLMNDNTVYEYQGTEICYLGFDEICHFSFKQFSYLLSRNRSTCGVKPYVRATCNPDKDSWVRNFIDWWIDPDTGLVIPERSGIIRYFTIVAENDINTFIWADDIKELKKYYSKQEWDAGARPRSFTFIPASLYDNKILLAKDPNYISSLKSQNKIDRERLLGGNWNISLSDYGNVLSRNDFFRYNLQEKLTIPGYFSESYFVLDGASKTNDANDYSVLGFWGKSVFDNRFYKIEQVRVKVLEPDLEQIIIDKWNYWNNLIINGQKIFNPKGINIEDKSSGQGLIPRLTRKGIPCFVLKAEKDKFLRLNDGLGIIKNQWVGIPDDAGWAGKFFDECECFRADGKHVLMDGEKKPHDDQVDELAYGVSSQINQIAAVQVYQKPKMTPRHGRGLGLYD